MHTVCDCIDFVICSNYVLIKVVECDSDGYMEVSPGLCVKIHSEEEDLSFRRAAELCQVEGGRLYEPRDVKVITLKQYQYQ